MVNHPLRKPYMDGMGILAARTPAEHPPEAEQHLYPKTSNTWPLQRWDAHTGHGG